MILIFNKKSILICFISSILIFFNCKVLVTSQSESIFLRLLKKMGFKIRGKSLLYLEINLQNIKNAGLIDGDCNKVSDRCVEKLYQSVDILNDLALFFHNIKDLQKKLKLFVYEYFDQLVYQQQLIIVWLKSSVYKNSLIINFSVLRPGAKRIWCSSDLKVIFIFNYLSFFLDSVGNTLVNLIKYLFRVFSLQLKRTLTNTNLKNELSQNNNFIQNDVLFFPHCGVVNYGHPPKDHFYSDQIDSPFHPSKIIHLEHDQRSNIEFEKEKMREYFKTDFIYYKRLINTHIPLFSAIRLIIKIFSTIKLFKYKNLGSNLLFYNIIFYAFVIFKRSRSSLEPYNSAKIALVGYEILFPKALTLALESLNIKTIATSERYLVGFTNNHTLNVNTLLSISEYTSGIIKESDRFLVNSIFPVGQVRTDHFFDNNILKSEYKKRVIVLDYHIENDFEEEKFNLILNWKNDINFRNEILSLAESYPEIEFIFRGKNCNWLKNKHHQQVISKADKLPNVSVDTDYSLNHWQSYHLCVSADLIIARPTSLAEECISKGMNVIVMDYGINYTIMVTQFLPRPLREYYCHSFNQLNEMFKFWIKNKFIISEEKKNQVKKELFSDYTDGKVKDRIQKYLNEIYVQPKQNNNVLDSTK
jgi:hypothetical protein